jgi:hypothetical protein
LESIVNVAVKKPSLARSILSVVLGLFFGAVVNGGVIALGSRLAPPPEGVNGEDVESIKANIHRYEPKHFAVPFLAHALGTLAGALTALALVSGQSVRGAYIIGAFFSVGGVAMILIVGGPLWFKVLDLGGAYIPMAWLATKVLARPAESGGG